MSKDAVKMEKIVALCKRRGFIFQSSEIYGGINGFWDYGPLGCELKRNIKDAWWQDMVRNPPLGIDGREVSMVGVDCSIIMNPKVWEASGHATGFADPMVDCTESKKRFRADKVWICGFYSLAQAKEVLEYLNEIHGELLEVLRPVKDGGPIIISDELKATLKELNSRQTNLIIPAILVAVEADSAIEAGNEAQSQLSKRQWEKLGTKSSPPVPVGPENSLVIIHSVQSLPDTWPRLSPVTQRETLTSPRAFNLMFKTFIGALEDSSNEAWLRPETAQGIFANFKNVCDSTRVKIPFGIAQVGKAFRNEINPRNFTFRSREFEQMEIEFFCHDKDALRWWEFWRDVRINWYKSLGMSGDKLVPRNQTEKELAHYSKACTDIEYLFPFADEPQELEGVAHRGCFDLTAHQTASGKDLSYFDDESKERFVPTVIEPSAGADRATLAFLCDAYTVDESRASPEFLKLHPRLAPIKAAVFPLVNKDGLPEIADPIYRDIRKRWPAQYDPKQSIGKRYARMDEAGTPFCFTIDGQSKEDGTVTVRDRDTGQQQRIDKSNCVQYLIDRLLTNL